MIPCGVAEPRSRNYIASRSYSRNDGLRLRLLSIYHRLGEVLKKKIMVADCAEEVL
jgi:hypothetical protein